MAPEAQVFVNQQNAKAIKNSKRKKGKIMKIIMNVRI